MIPQYNTAEGGVNGVTPTTADTGSGDPLGAVVPGTVSVVRYSSARPAHGALGYELANNTATAEQASIGQIDTAGGAAHVDGSFYYTCPVTPTANTRVARLRKSSAGVAGSIYHSTANKLQVRHGSDALLFTFTTAMIPGTKYRIEWEIIVNGTTTVTLQVRLYQGDTVAVMEDSGPQTVTATAAVSAIDEIQYGGGVTSAANWPSATGSQFFDDPKFGYTTWTGPAPADVTITPPAATMTMRAGSFTADVTVTAPAATLTLSVGIPGLSTSPSKVTIFAPAATITFFAVAPKVKRRVSPANTKTLSLAPAGAGDLVLVPDDGNTF